MTAHIAEAVSIGHLTIKPVAGNKIESDCSICHLGITIPERFGPIPGDVMLAEWIKQHAHTPKKAKSA